MLNIGKNPEKWKVEFNKKMASASSKSLFLLLLSTILDLSSVLRGLKLKPMKDTND